MGVQVLPRTPEFHMKQIPKLNEVTTLLFDLDGVLVNTEELSHNVFVGMAKELGSEFAKEDHIKILGTEESFWSNYLSDRWNGKLSAEDVAKTFWERLSDQKQNSVSLHVGVLELLNILKAEKKRIGLVSNSPRKEVLDILEEKNVLKYFDVIVSADDCKKKKPDPEPYLKAIKELGIDPSSAFVIEDSETGAESGKRAGCVVVGIPTVYAGKTKLDNAAYNFKSLQSFTKAII